MSKNKPCPFCGSNDSSIRLAPNSVFVGCDACGGSGPGIFVLYTIPHDLDRVDQATILAARMAWDGRAKPETEEGGR